jgi:hypothetical protein
MAEEDSLGDTEAEIKHFAATFCNFHRAFPDENQHIFGQIYEQVLKADTHDREYLPSEKGQEEIWVFRKNGTVVYKRVFHPGSGEKASGVDFALYKKVSLDKVGITAVQVKRNRNKPYFEFSKRDLTQRNRIGKLWGSAYYLMVDETIGPPPLYCFITATELLSLIEEYGRNPPVRIPNEEVRRFCRGLNLFYQNFYSCLMGSHLAPKDYLAKIDIFVRRSKRAVVEISTKPSARAQINY